MSSKVNSVFLRGMKIENFGAFSNKTVGPFTPQLNVIFGKNEAGKTTLNAFLGGVLFGWEEARGLRNTYKPKNVGRCGSLFFLNKETEEEYELTRVKNVDGLQGSSFLIEDIDKETYLRMFALTSDELLTLKNTTDVTAKLLTAGSGTEASPAFALAEIQSRLAEYTSKATGIEHSLVRLKQQQEVLREELKKAREEAERFKRQDIEFHELGPRREEVTNRLRTLNREIEQLTAHKASFEKLNVQDEKNITKQNELRKKEKELLTHRPIIEASNSKLIQKNLREEEALYEKIEALSEMQSENELQVAHAKETHRKSKAEYEALLETGDIQEKEQRAKRQRRVQVVLSILLPLVFVLVGVLVFMQGRETSSLSFTALGICLVVFALLLAGAALAMLFRPDKRTEELAQRKQDALWVMVQDKKILTSREEDLRKQEKESEAFLDGVGLHEAQGSLKQARKMLDAAKDMRARMNLYTQNQQALASQLSDIAEDLSESELLRNNLLEEVSLAQDTSLEAFDVLLNQKIQQREKLTEASGNINRRYGELEQELSFAQQMNRFDELKIEYQQIRTQQKEGAEDYARLLLAKRTLEAAIGAWESKSQPEVYKQASRLFAHMTKGAWTQIRMTPEGRLRVVNEVKTLRDPIHLSLSTCQQLYLSLRIALLMKAENVGRAIPLMADDILVNFDADRRVGAAEALHELAQVRQVILFTCHEEVVELMQTVDSQTNVLEL